MRPLFIDLKEMVLKAEVKQLIEHAYKIGYADGLYYSEGNDASAAFKAPCEICQEFDCDGCEFKSVGVSRILCLGRLQHKILRGENFQNFLDLS